MGFNPDRNWHKDHQGLQKDIKKLEQGLAEYKKRVAYAKDLLASLRGSTLDDKLAVRLAEIHYVLIGLEVEK